MKLGMLSTAALFGATMLFGQATSGQNAAQAIPRETSEKVTVDSPTTTLTIDTKTAVGRVTGFEAGKSVTITRPGNKTQKYDLSKENTLLGGNPNVRVGQIISLTETKEANRRMVTIQPYARGVRTDTATETAIMQAETRASSEVPHEITREVKRSTPQGDTASTTTTAAGQVRAYKQGDSLKVTAPHNKTKDFNLKNVTITGSQDLRVGQTVKVTEVKQGNTRSISIQPVARTRG